MADEEEVKETRTAAQLLQEFHEARTALGHAEVRGVDTQLFNRMKSSGWTTLVPKVSNSVTNGLFYDDRDIPISLPLQTMAPYIAHRCVRLNARSFPTLVVPLIGRSIRGTLLLFAVGKVVITGCTVKMQVLLAVRYTLKLLHDCGYTHLAADPAAFTVENQVASFTMPSTILKKDFMERHSIADQSGDFPGCTYHFVNTAEHAAKTRKTALVFNSNKSVFVGWRTRDELAAMTKVMSVLLFQARAGGRRRADEEIDYE